MTRLMYVAHPLGVGSARSENIARFEKWLPWLLERYTGDAMVAPWYPYAKTISEDHRERGLRDDLAVLSSCDGIILCGQRVSPGMLTELIHYVKSRSERGLPLHIVDHTGHEYPFDIR